MRRLEVVKEGHNDLVHEPGKLQVDEVKQSATEGRSEGNRSAVEAVCRASCIDRYALKEWHFVQPCGVGLHSPAVQSRLGDGENLEIGKLASAPVDAGALSVDFSQRG